MSQHHRAQKWTTHSPKLREKIKPRLPLPCVNCPHLVTREDRWQVGHIRDAATGGRPVIGNVGPAHTFCEVCGKACNQVAGGKLGAAIVNGRRQKSQDIRPW